MISKAGGPNCILAEFKQSYLCLFAYSGVQDILNI